MHICWPGWFKWVTTISWLLLYNAVFYSFIAKSCVSLCISSMQRMQTETPVELVEMFRTLFSILKDSTAITSVLMDDFRSCHAYLFLSDYLLQLGEMAGDEAVEACRDMVICVSSFTLVGYTPLRPPTSIGAPFQESDFQIPETTENGKAQRLLGV